MRVNVTALEDLVPISTWLLIISFVQLSLEKHSKTGQLDQQEINRLKRAVSNLKDSRYDKLFLEAVSSKKRKWLDRQFIACVLQDLIAGKEPESADLKKADEFFKVVGEYCRKRHDEIMRVRI